ncbi:polyadenylate-binding protein 1-like 2 [Biomphalaria glabrata]|uniref:Polyadenylate-binding protein 1-like 2 n=1 Tax=Biomphalaria glabrata TaxID=6526 RepID=A0A9U8DU97_BIOGL|nr:polyadenylate-binding protein 1-like 2 [Biomphalaria glabrata]KAI8736834.1 polyadenylate-binding protein 1-like 2 [Biomphalaria glabrata]KAI8776847.1 polyadenylate-binding protein 1 2 [Biomphalaria glabrata]
MASAYTSALYVGNLHPDVTEALLFETFSSFGKICSVKVYRDLLTRTSLGYACVAFLQQPDAERALKVMNNASLKDKPLQIMWAHLCKDLLEEDPDDDYSLDYDLDYETLLD